MNLTDRWFEARFQRVTPTSTGYHDHPTFEGATGVFFWCPCSYGQPKHDGRHGISIPFTSHDPARGWDASGPSLADLTVTPSIKNSGPDGECWHGYLTSGELKAC